MVQVRHCHQNHVVLGFRVENHGFRGPLLGATRSAAVQGSVHWFGNPIRD